MLPRPSEASPSYGERRGTGGLYIRKSLLKDNGTVGEFLRPMFEGCFTAILQFDSVVGTSHLPVKFSQSHPSARNTNRIAKIVVYIEIPGHEFFLEFLIGVNGLTVLTSPRQIVGGGAQGVIGLAHRLDFLGRVNFCITQ